MLLYVAGPYSGDTDQNINEAKEVAIKLWEKGHAVICPHLNTAHFENYCSCSYDDYMDGDLMMLARCDGVVMLPRWIDSPGAQIEHEYADLNQIPIWYYPDTPDLHVTEVTRPKQVEGFISTIMGMYRTHLSKNADYSPASILATGELGLATRLWDKMTRLMNLLGFRFEIIPQPMDPPREPKHESIDDTLKDTAVYSVIGTLLRQGVWGK